MINKDEFQLGKLYYMCTFSSDEIPVPEVEPYILERADESGFHFIGPSVLAAHRILKNLTLNERQSIENILAENRTLYVPYSELGTLFETPSGAIDFLKDSLSSKALKEFL
ncbi:hypothetical protein ACK25U_06840 [Ectopseudomonas mendocina]